MGQNGPVLCCDPMMLVPFVAGADRNTGVRGHLPVGTPHQASKHMGEGC